jgi:hypothetical protein
VKVGAEDTEAAGKSGREEVEKAKVVTADLAKTGADFEAIRLAFDEIVKNADGRFPVGISAWPDHRSESD